MTSIDAAALTELNHAIDEAFDDDVPCAMREAGKLCGAPSILYGIQIPELPCGCVGRCLPFCKSCLAIIRRAEFTPCPQRGIILDVPQRELFVRWEPIPGRTP